MGGLVLDNNYQRKIEHHQESKPSILTLERAFKIYCKGYREVFYDFCKINGIKRDDIDRIIQKHNWLRGLALPLKRNIVLPNKRPTVRPKVIKFPSLPSTFQIR